MTFQTPAQLKGYKVGDKFKVLSDVVGFKEGQFVTLDRDDGSSVPMFKGANDRYTLADGGHSEGAFLSLQFVEKVEEPEFKVGDTVKIVRIKSGFERRCLNMEGKITYIDDSSLPVKVAFIDADGDYDHDWGRFDELELVPQSAPIDAASVRQKLEAIEKLAREIKELLG